MNSKLSSCIYACDYGDIISNEKQKSYLSEIVDFQLYKASGLSVNEWIFNEGKYVYNQKQFQSCFVTSFI